MYYYYDAIGNMRWHVRWIRMPNEHLCIVLLAFVCVFFLLFLCFAKHMTVFAGVQIQLTCHHIRAFCIDSIRFEYYTNIIMLDSIQKKKMKLCSCNK